MGRQEPEFAVFSARWRNVRARTFAILDKIPKRHRTARVWSGGRSVLEVVAHLTAAQRAILDGLESGSIRFGTAEADAAERGWDELLADARDLDQTLERILLDKPAHWWNEEISDGLSRSTWLWEMLEHEIHHRAQIPLAIRVNGGVPPRIYA